MAMQRQSVPLARLASLLNPFIDDNESTPLNGADEIRCASSGDRLASPPFQRDYGRIGPHMGSTQYFPLSIFSWPFFASFFVSFFLMTVSSFVAFPFIGCRDPWCYLPVTMGPHMGSTQHFASISFLGVTFLISSFSIFLMGLPPCTGC
jgi:hypothetical protein